MAKTYYAILEVRDGADAEEIRSSYRRLAKLHHPDHCGGNADSFREVQEAWNVLGDDHLRRQYDRNLRKPLPRPRPMHRQGPGPEPLIPNPPADVFGDIALTRSFRTAAPSFDEINDWLWSSVSGIGTPKSGRIERLTMEVPIGPEQARRGGTARVMVPACVACPACRGLGRLGFFECHRCAGAGAISGEVPVAIEFPPGLGGDQAMVVPLDRLGIHNLHLTVLFRTSGE